MRKHIVLSYILSLFLIPALVSSCAFLPREDPVLPPPLIYSYESAKYQFVTVTRGSVADAKDVHVSYVAARQKVQNFALSGVLIKSVNVSKGDEVVKGQILAELERDDIVARIAQTRHDLDMLDMAMRQLGEEEALGRRLDAVTGAADDGRWQRRRDDLQGKIDIMRLNIDNLRNQDAQRVIVSEIDGVVTSVYEFTDGELSSEIQPIVTVSDKTLSVFKVTGPDAKYFEAGAVLSVKSGGADYPGTVVEAGEIGAEAGEQLAYIQLSDPVVDITGSYGIVRVVLEERENVLYLPAAVVKKANDQTFVYMQDSNGVRIARDVEIGLVGNNQVEIISGLEEGDVVIAG